MASRLLCRYAHLLCKSSSQVPAAAASAARLPSHIGPAEVKRMRGWPLITERLMSKRTKVTLKENDQITPTPSRLDDLLEKATEPEDVLDVWAKQQKKGNQAGEALVRWTQLMVMRKGKCPEQFSKGTADSRLQNIMAALSEEVTLMRSNSLVAVLRSLWTMAIPATHPLLRSVQNEVLWRLRGLTLMQLAHLVEWGAVQKEQQDVALVNAALKQLELRWTEISEVKTLNVLMSKGARMPPTLLDKLDDKALELGESFSAEEIRNLCVSLAVQGRRCVPLLRAMSYHLLQKPSTDFTTQLMLDMAFAYGKLNFHQSQVLQRMASELLPRTPALSSIEVIRFAKSLGFLKWLHIPLFESFAEHYIANSDTYNALLVSNLIMTFARLGFQPSKGEQLYNKVHLVLQDSLCELEPFLQTDVVWSLCVLQQAKPSYLLPLTQSSHTSKVSGNPARGENYKLKLLHIAATLQLEHPGSSASLPHLSVPSSSSRPLSVLQSSLRESLQDLVGEKTEALRTGVDTVYGWTIDGEMVVDCDNKPMDISQLKAPHLPSGGGREAVPVGAYRLAFLAWEFPHFGSKSKQLLGRFTLMKRHLQLAGFITVEVPFYEFLDVKTKWQKLAYLKDKMGKAVAEEIAK